MLGFKVAKKKNFHFFASRWTRVAIALPWCGVVLIAALFHPLNLFSTRVILGILSLDLCTVDLAPERRRWSAASVRWAQGGQVVQVSTVLVSVL